MFTFYSLFLHRSNETQNLHDWPVWLFVLWLPLSFDAKKEEEGIEIHISYFRNQKSARMTRIESVWKTLAITFQSFWNGEIRERAECPMHIAHYDSQRMPIVSVETKQPILLQVHDVHFANILCRNKWSHESFFFVDLNARRKTERGFFSYNIYW